MAPFRFGRNSSSAQSPLLRVVNYPAGLHQSLRDSVGLGPRPGGSSSPVPGRLAGPGLYRGQSQTARPEPSISVQLPWGSTQQRKVRPQPITVGGVSRHDHRHSGCPSLPYSTSHRQVHRHCEKIPIASGTPRPALAGVVGTHVIAGEAGPPRKTQNALTPMASEVTLVPGERPSQPPGTPLPAGRGGPLLVDGEGPPTRGDTLRNSDPDLCLYSDASRTGWGAHLLDQSVSGVWSHQESSLHINPLEMKALFLALRSFNHLVTDHQVTAMCDNSTVVAYVNKQGGHSLRLPLLVDRATSPMDGIQQGPTGSEVPAGTIQRPGGPTQPPQPSPGCGMVASPSGSKGPTANVGFPHSRPVRNTSQCQAASVLLPDPGSPGPLRGCLPAPLGQSRHVRVPSLPSGRESSGLSQRDPKSLDDSSRPSLAGEGVVRGTTPPPDPTTSGTTTVGSTATTTPLPLVPRRRPRPEPSRVAAPKCLLRKSGFSREAALEMSSCVRESTARLYQSQWLFLWLVSWKGHCSNRRHYTYDRGLSHSLD